MKQLKEHFPPGIDYAIVYDTTPFIKESIREVFETLFDAIVLVAVVVLVFLQNWRSTLIPLIAVPVAVVGTFAVMAAMGFSLNNLTLFGLVLAIGIVVDDAIVVVEAVEHHIEHGMTPREATHQGDGAGVRAGHRDRPGAVGGVRPVRVHHRHHRAVLPSVRLDHRRLDGDLGVQLADAQPGAVGVAAAAAGKGQASKPLPWFAFVPIGAWLGHKMRLPLFRRLGRTGAASDRPVELADVRRSCGARSSPGRSLAAVVGLLLGGPINALLGWSFRAFNTGFDRLDQRVHRRRLAAAARQCCWCSWSTAGLLVPDLVGLHPHADRIHSAAGQGLPARQRAAAGRGLGRPAHAGRGRADRGDRPGHAGRQAHGRHLRAVDPAQRQRLQFRRLYLMLDDFERSHVDPTLSGEAIADRAAGAASRRKCREAIVNIFGAPPVEGLGTAGGFKIIVQDTGDNGSGDAAEEPPTRWSTAGEADPHLHGLFTSFRADTPWLELIIDRTQAKDRGVSIDDIRTTLESTIGPYYINDFNRFGRTWQVNVQARDAFRQSVDDIKQLKIRNNMGEMVPLADFATVAYVSGPVMVMRYNMYPAARHSRRRRRRTPVPARQSPAMEQVANEQICRSRCGTEWTELALLAASDRQHRHVGLLAGGRAGVPGAGGPVRKLGAAAGRHPGRADVFALRRSPACVMATWTSTSSRRSASWCWSGWRARTPS